MAAPVGPRELGWMESALAALAGTALTGAERVDAIVVIVGHARMIAEQAASRQSEAQLNAAIGLVVASTRTASRSWPRRCRSPARTAEDQAFEFGLDRILDGLEALIRGRAERL